MTKKLISIGLVLIFIICMFSVLGVTASAVSVSGYDSSSALSYAANNWNNGIGLCADFASKCIQAGGINVYAAGVTDLYNKLNGTYGISHKLTLTEGTKGSIKLSDNVGKVDKGDLIFYYCNCCGSFTHVVVCNGANSQGFIQDYAHNNAHNGQKQTYTYEHCGSDNWTMYSIDLDEEDVRYGVKTSVETPKIISLANGANGITIKWSTINEADKYRLYRKTADSGWKCIAQGPKTAFTDKTTVNGETYYYTVRAVDNNVFSQYYAGKAVVSINAPQVSTSNRLGSVLIKWTKVDKADGYYVYRVNENGRWARIATIKDANKLSYADKDVQNGVTYRYTVKAYVGSKHGAYNAKGKSIIYVDAPTAFTAQTSATGTVVSFSAIPGATSYKCYKKAVDDPTWTVVGFTQNPSFVDSTGVKGVEYQYTVRALNGSTASYYYKNAISCVYGVSNTSTTAPITTTPATTSVATNLVTTIPTV